MLARERATSALMSLGTSSNRAPVRNASPARIASPAYTQMLPGVWPGECATSSPSMTSPPLTHRLMCGRGPREPIATTMRFTIENPAGTRPSRYGRSS